MLSEGDYGFSIGGRGLELVYSYYGVLPVQSPPLFWILSTSHALPPKTQYSSYFMFPLLPVGCSIAGHLAAEAAEAAGVEGGRGGGWVVS